jgi:hypothetical protein
MGKFLKVLLAVAFIAFCFRPVHAQNTKNKGIFIGYETLEMVMNKFQYFAGEVGYRFNTEHQMRLMIGVVKLTERHLSSD